MEDESLQGLWQSAKAGHPRYIIQDGLLYAKDDKCEQPGLLIVPRQYRNEILELAHHKLTGDHAGRKRTDQKFKIAVFWWPVQSKEVRNYLKSCKPC